MENITHTIHNVTEGLIAQNEYDILPVYVDGELANATAFRACLLKRFMQHTGQAAVQACDWLRQASAVIDPTFKWTIGVTIGMTAVALAGKILG